MRIAFLWTGLSGYMNACLKELSARDGIELFVSYELPGTEAPFEEAQFAWISNRVAWRSQPQRQELMEKLQEFAPEVVVVPSWHIGCYRQAARALAGRCRRIMIMDNPWSGSLKQYFGALVSHFYVKPIADMIWLPGERQANFARRLGFSQDTILRGSFTCDQPAFSAVHESRVSSGQALQRRFIFVGRMVPTKSVDVLVEAYKIYRKANADPWPLICCGLGPLRSLVENEQGIRVDGFVQPANLPRVFGSAGCLVLPSKFEPWALVVHEAAAAGLLILASENVGAVTHLVQPGYNGFIFTKNDIAGLARLMSRVSSMSDARLDQMSRASHLLSLQFSPKQWADTLIQSCHPVDGKVQ